MRVYCSIMKHDIDRAMMRTIHHVPPPFQWTPGRTSMLMIAAVESMVSPYTKESPMTAVLKIGPAPAIIQTADTLNSGVVFVDNRGYTHLRILGGYVPLNRGAVGAFDADRSAASLRELIVSRVVGPLELSTS